MSTKRSKKTGEKGKKKQAIATKKSTRSIDLVLPIMENLLLIKLVKLVKKKTSNSLINIIPFAISEQVDFFFEHLQLRSNNDARSKCRKHSKRFKKTKNIYVLKLHLMQSFLFEFEKKFNWKKLKLIERNHQ